MNNIKILDVLDVLYYEPRPIDFIKANWNLYKVRVKMDNGSEIEGFMEGDIIGNMWAFESFIKDENYKSINNEI